MSLRLRPEEPYILSVVSRLNLKIQWGPGPLFPRVNRPGRGEYQSLPYIVEVKNAWGYTSKRHHGVVLS